MGAIREFIGGNLTMNPLSQTRVITSRNAGESSCNHYAFSLTLTLSRWEREKRLPRPGKMVASWFMGAMHEIFWGKSQLGPLPSRVGTAVELLLKVYETWSGRPVWATPGKGMGLKLALNSLYRMAVNHYFFALI